MRLLDLLARQWPAAHRVALRALLAEGQIRVDGALVRADRVLREGAVVALPAVADLAPFAAAGAWPLAVLADVAGAIVIHKPPGLVTVPDRARAEGSVHALLPALGSGADLRIVHRLDRDTSGCLLLAKGGEAARHFDAAWRAGKVRKTYLALVHGVPAAREFAVDLWLGPDRKRPGKVVAAPAKRPGYRDARTEIARREQFGAAALLELRPTTGRGHQLRVHLQAIGHPIVGDRDYGGAPLLLSQWKRGYHRRRGVPERPLLSRMFLHAERLVFPDVDGREVEVVAPLPDDLATALRKLRKFAADRRGPCD